MLMKFNDVGGIEFVHHITTTKVTIRRIRDKFQVDGTVQDVLKGRCGRGSATVVPASISRFSPSGFYLWGILKKTVYATKLQTLKELRDQIELAINDIPLAAI